MVADSASPSSPAVPAIRSPKRGIQRGIRNELDKAIATPADIINMLTCQVAAENFWITKRAEVLLIPLKAKLKIALASSKSRRPGLRPIWKMEMTGLRSRKWIGVWSRRSKGSDSLRRKKPTIAFKRLIPPAI